MCDISFNFFPGRSPTIIAAYLMYTQKINHDDALNLIKDRRPIVEYSGLLSVNSSF